MRERDRGRKWRPGIVGSVALAGVLGLALLVGLIIGPPGTALAAGETTYTSCADAIANFPTDLAGVTSGSATFTFPNNCTIDLTGALTIQAGVTITINGNGLTLVGKDASTDVIDMAGTSSSISTLSLNDVTVKDGRVGINAGGSDGTVDLNGEGGDGGTIMLTDSVVSGNASDGVHANGGSGIKYGYGGNGGTLILINSTISGNTGSGVNVGGGKGGGGDGIGDARGGGHGGSVTLTDSTISDNGSDGINADGGVGGSTDEGSRGGFGGKGGTVTLTNSTISGSASDGISASGAAGGGGYSNGGSGGAGGVATLTSSTISGNTGAGVSAPGGNGGAGGVTGSLGTGGTVDLTATILANTGANCAGGSLSDNGYSLSTDASCGFSVDSTSKNSVPLTGAGGLNPLPLANYGGPTQTVALGTDSIGIDAIPLSGGHCVVGSQTDQRGMPRPQGSGCDVGAYELIQGAYTVTEQTCPTQAQLQGDLDLATPGSSLTINLPPNCTIPLTSPLTIGAGIDVTLNGNGLTLDGQTQAFDDIDIHDTEASPSTLILNQVTLENGNSGVLELNYEATVNLNSSTVRNNAYAGAGSAGTVNVTDSFFSGNQFGVVAGTAMVSSTTITTSSNAGVVAGTAFLTNDTITRSVGAAVGVESGATVTFSTLSGNGVGIVAQNATPVKLTSTILANSAGNCSSGVAVTDGGYSLSTDTTCAFADVTTSWSNVPSSGGLNLLSLGSYGGPTPTIALGPNSVAIDLIPVNASGQCAVGAGDGQPIVDPITNQPITTDQRGIDRSQGAGCDAGAYEAPAVTITTSPSQPASSGWFNATTVGGQGRTLGVSVGFTGLVTGELPSCSGATFTGLPATAVTGLNQMASGSTSLGDGQYAISCGVSQGATALGFSQTPAQPLTLKIDTTPPSGGCSVPDQSPWYDHNFSISCTPIDATSGLSNTTPNQFSLTTTTTTGTADASASTTSQEICDVAGNCKAIGPFDFKVDLALPTISAPAANATYPVDQVVTLGCADVGSGIKTCQVTITLPNGSTTNVSQGNAIPTGSTGTYTVSPNTVTDVAGNADTTVFTYTVGYQITTLPGNTATVQRGYYALIRFAPEDSRGHDLARRNLTVTSVELDGPGGQVIPFVHPLQYGTFSGKAGYQLSINARNLTPGRWTLIVRIGSGSSATTGSIDFTVE